MNYEEARVYLDGVSKYGSVLGLENIRQLLLRLDNPQDDLKFIHIAGTNGKGSLLAYISTILKEAGYTVGRYISPTLFSYRERIQVNEQYIEKEALARLTTKIAKAVEEMNQEGMQPTIFELETAMSFLYFKEKQCDVVVLEVGFGGLEDATNIVTTTILEVITKIGIDHVAILGDTLEEIAKNKAGIIKPDTVVVSMEQRPEVQKILEETCKEKHTSLFVAKKEELREVCYGLETQSFCYRGERYEISLAGSYQIENAALAVEAIRKLRTLGYLIPEEALLQGLKKTVWRGRFTVLQTEPLFLMDGAHNADGAKVLRESLQQYVPEKKLFYIMGMFQDKEVDKVLEYTAPLAEAILTIETPDNPRAMPKELLAEKARKYNSCVRPAESIEAAVRESLEQAGKDDVIVAFGSLSFLKEIELQQKSYLGRA